MMPPGEPQPFDPRESPPHWGTPDPGLHQRAERGPESEWVAAPPEGAAAPPTAAAPAVGPVGPVGPAAPAAPVGAPVLVTIGDIACTQTEVITPAGRMPVGSVVWTFTDMSTTTRGIPTWAIVLAVVGFVFCLLGLLFLLVKETRTTGWVQITVQGPRFVHQVQLPVSSPEQVADYGARVSYARSLSAAAG